MNLLLKVNNLRIEFYRNNKWQEIVHGIDLEVHKGKTLGIVGESGSGKSVSNLAILQLLDKRKSRIKVDSILLNGNDISDLNDDEMTEIRGKKIAMIFQEPMTSLNPVYKCGFQVMEAIKIILGKGEVLSGKMFMFNGMTLMSKIIRSKQRNESCPVCAGKKSESE